MADGILNFSSLHIQSQWVRKKPETRGVQLNYLPIFSIYFVECFWIAQQIDLIIKLNCAMYRIPEIEITNLKRENEMVIALDFLVDNTWVTLP